MHKATIQYRLYPTPAQERKLQETLEECRWLYNRLLEERKLAWEETDTAVLLYDQVNRIPTLKAERPTLNTVHSQVLQNVAMRLDLAFQAFFRRVKAGRDPSQRVKPGYPRFRGRGWYDSFCYPGSGFKLSGQRVSLSKIGHIKAIIHRPLDGTVKTCCVRCTSTGKWFVTLACDVADMPLPKNDSTIGIDVGLTTFAMLSDGGEIANPRFLRRDEKDLARAQRRKEHAATGSPARRRQRKVEQRIHERIAHRRKDFAHQHSRHIVNHYSTIAVENLSVNRMVHNRCLAKSISDAAWSQFIAFLSYKAASAGRRYVAVNSAYTSQECSCCGHRQKMPLSERVYRCPCCHLVLSRDVNAATNILRLGLQSLGAEP